MYIAAYELSESSNGVLSDINIGGVLGVNASSSSSRSEPSSGMGISLGPTREGTLASELTSGMGISLGPTCEGTLEDSDCS